MAGPDFCPTCGAYWNGCGCPSPEPYHLERADILVVDEATDMSQRVWDEVVRHLGGKPLETLDQATLDMLTNDDLPNIRILPRHWYEQIQAYQQGRQDGPQQ